MPSPEQILAGLQQTASEWVWLAIAWHVLFGAIALLLIGGWRPPLAVFATLLALPLLSVSVLAWLSGNPFNGTLFALAALAVVVLRPRPGQVEVAGAPWVVLGSLMFAFGWAYPHFLPTLPLASLYAAPTGLIPCPTLSIVIGLAVIVGGLGSKRLSSVLVAMGLFYGFFGAIRLGVEIDWVLIVGALELAAVNFAPRNFQKFARA